MRKIIIVIFAVILCGCGDRDAARRSEESHAGGATTNRTASDQSPQESRVRLGEVRTDPTFGKTKFTMEIDLSPSEKNKKERQPNNH